MYFGAMKIGSYTLHPLETGRFALDGGAMFGVVPRPLWEKAAPPDERTITYRREVFYPIMSWGDVSADGAGLTLLTHGLQGLGGTRTLNLMLVREVSDGCKGLPGLGFVTFHRYDETEITTRMRVDSPQNRRISSPPHVFVGGDGRSSSAEDAQVSGSIVA